MNLIKRVKNILLTPKTEWQVIKGEPLSIAGMFTKYAMILAAIPAVAGFIGYVVIGVSFGFGTFRMPFSTALIWAILTYILSLGGIFLLAFIIDTLAPTFGCTKDLTAAVKIVVFSYTAAWVAGILNIIPALAILVSLASIYSLYLMYMGMQKIKDVPKDKMMGYFVVTIIAAIVVFFIIGFLVSRVAFGSMAGLAGLSVF